MIVSEQASNQDDLADNELCFPKIIIGDSTRGGWKPYLLNKIIIDWECPTCKQSIDMCQSGRMICPSCGLHVKDLPIRKEPLQKSRLIYSYRRWIDHILNPEELE